MTRTMLADPLDSSKPGVPPLGASTSPGADNWCLAGTMAALGNSPEAYAKIFRFSPDAISINRLSDWAYIDINEGFSTISGYSPAEAIGHTSLDDGSGPWFDASEQQRLLALLHEHGEATGFESRFRAKNGSIVSGLLSARALDIGGTACVLSILRDISDRKRAEAALQRSEERFRSLVELAVDAILLGDPAGNITGANQQAVELTGYVVDELRCLNIGQLFSLEERRRKPLRYDLLQQQQVITTERLLLRKDGRTIPIEMTSRMMPDGTYHAFLRDISLRLQIDAERVKSEQRISESRKLEALGQLAGGIAHDFNNQLAGIIGNAELLSRRLDDPAMRPFAERIITAAERSASLTRQLLSFARKGRNVSVDVDIRHLINEVVELLSHSIDKRIAIRLHLEESGSVIHGDPDQLQNALLNLGLNARDAMPEGGTLTFATSLIREAPGSADPEIPTVPCLRLAVIDTGVGMSDETRRHLFEPFFTTKQHGKGTGLGLASVYGTVKDHHGTIRISSQIGQGTTVEIHLPLRPAAAVAIPGGTPTTTTPATGSGRILLVDDDAYVREATADSLRSLGYAVSCCPDGTAAVDVYRQEWPRIDLVILDLVMPNMGGRDAFIAMRAINPDVRALISSGYSLDGEIQELLGLGVTGCLRKPFRLAELGERVAAIVRCDPSA